MTETSNTHADEQELHELLKEYPAPEAPADFYERALVIAARQGARRQRNRSIMTGFGGAVTAGLAILLVSGLFTGDSAPPAPEAQIPGVTMALAEPRTVNLVFSSTEALDSARLSVILPAGIELAGFPGQSEVTWETSLAKGRNLLPLKLVALTPAGGEVLARLEHDNRNRTFRLRVDVS